MSKLLRVSCGIILKDNQVLCAQRSEIMSHSLKWEFPGGKVEDGEMPEETLNRELREELNIQVKVLKSFGNFPYRYNDTLEVDLLPFICQLVDGNLSPNEHKNVRWVAIENLEKLDWVEADIPIMLKFKSLYLSF